MMDTTWSTGLSVSADGTGVVAHAGSTAVRLLADRTGLTKELSKATARRSFLRVHDRGSVLVDVAVLLPDGGEASADIDVLRHQGQVLGPVASAPTVWRALDELTPAALRRIRVARARVRRHVRAHCRRYRPPRSPTPTSTGSWSWMSTRTWSPRSELAAPTFDGATASTRCARS